MSSEYDICKLFPAMSLEDTQSPSSSSGKLLHKEKKKKKKKEEALRKLSGGVKKKKEKKKKSNKKKKEVDEMEEWWHLGRQTSCGERKRGWRLLGVNKLGGTYIATITHPDGRQVRLGTYMTPKLAAIAYDQESLKIYGLQKPLNFPHRVIIAGASAYQYNNRTRTQ